jgi:hypothetical protein
MFKVSIRINERKQRRESDNKKLAYLLDLKTVSLEDLAFGYSLGQVHNLPLENDIFTCILNLFWVKTILR